MTAADFRRIALSMPEAAEGAHFGNADFRVGGKIFATLALEKEGYGVLLLSPEEQAGMVEDAPDVFSPVPGGCPMVNTAVENDDGNQALKERARQAVSIFLNRLVETIKRGIEQGEIKHDTDAGTFALLLFSALEGALIVSRLQGSFKPLEVVARTLEQYLNERMVSGT